MKLSVYAFEDHRKSELNSRPPQAHLLWTVYSIWTVAYPIRRLVNAIWVMTGMIFQRARIVHVFLLEK